jgi:hypothetical protein
MADGDTRQEGGKYSSKPFVVRSFLLVRKGKSHHLTYWSVYCSVN